MKISSFVGSHYIAETDEGVRIHPEEWYGGTIHRENTRERDPILWSLIPWRRYLCILCLFFPFSFGLFFRYAVPMGAVYMYIFPELTWIIWGMVFGSVALALLCILSLFPLPFKILLLVRQKVWYHVDRSAVRQRMIDSLLATWSRKTQKKGLPPPPVFKGPPQQTRYDW